MHLRSVVVVLLSYRLRFWMYSECNSVLGVFSNSAARFWPSPFFTQWPYTRNAQPSMTYVGEKEIEWFWEISRSSYLGLHSVLTFRRILTRYGSRSASSTFKGSAVKRKRRIRTMARTHRMANRNFLRALNKLWRRFYFTKDWSKDTINKRVSLRLSWRHGLRY